MVCTIFGSFSAIEFFFFVVHDRNSSSLYPCPVPYYQSGFPATTFHLHKHCHISNIETRLFHIITRLQSSVPIIPAAIHTYSSPLPSTYLLTVLVFLGQFTFVVVVVVVVVLVSQFHQYLSQLFCLTVCLQNIW